ncbi:tenascin-X-like [Eriocheir sinensis]|uniref:tenascin-X-like n=1 Tax=Eriocheir sinensis TaxID=95602 RepID=UPI0021C88B98|nr:tenascin-X-like [Eriocheir sinensis]
MQEVSWWQREGVVGPAARGGVCASSETPLYPVSFPLMSSKALLVPEFLSYTISIGEDLRVRLHGAVPGADVWWQQEPLEPGRWKQATLTKYGELLVPAAMLSGSGFYSLRNDSNVNDTVSGIMGTFSLVVRECPALRYGDDCRDWCPDCMHGGECHPRSGVCVCPEGVMGRLCEKRCGKNMSGRDCTVRVMNLPGRQVCRPSPVPCRCLPGFTGPRCNEECPLGKWGSNCGQDCRLHCAANCDGFTGECDAEGPSQCAGGDAGLPRLRQAPVMKEVGAEEATIEFAEWREGYDDGDATPWDSLTHVVRLRTDKLSLDFITSGSRHRLTKLTPATQYEVKVVVVVAAMRGGLNLTCVADGTGRERVHNVTFTTLCPKEIPMPEIIDIVKTSDASILVRWKPVSYPPVCHLKYHLSVIPEAQGETSPSLETRNVTLTETQTEVQGLEAEVQYTIRVFASSSSSSSAPSTSSLQIYQKSVGHAEVGMVVAVVVLLTAVTAAVLWRRRQRKRKSMRPRNRQPENTPHALVPTEEVT